MTINIIILIPSDHVKYWQRLTIVLLQQRFYLLHIATQHSNEVSFLLCRINLYTTCHNPIDSFPNTCPICHLIFALLQHQAVYRYNDLSNSCLAILLQLHSSWHPLYSNCFLRSFQIILTFFFHPRIRNTLGTMILQPDMVQCKSY